MREGVIIFRVSELGMRSAATPAQAPQVDPGRHQAAVKHESECTDCASRPAPRFSEPCRARRPSSTRTRSQCFGEHFPIMLTARLVIADADRVDQATHFHTRASPARLRPVSQRSCMIRAPADNPECRKSLNFW